MFRINFFCDDVGSTEEHLRSCNFKKRLVTFPIGIICLLVTIMIITLASNGWEKWLAVLVFGIIGVVMVGSFVFNGKFTEWEYKNNQDEIAERMKMTGRSREEAIQEINASRIAQRNSRPPPKTQVNVPSFAAPINVNFN